MTFATVLEWIRNIAGLMGALGIPTAGVIYKATKKRRKDKDEEKKKREADLHNKVELLMKAHQLQLRRILMDDYIKHSTRGTITAEDLQDWEEIYQSYHSLGQNGVMDARRQQLLALQVVTKYE